MRGTCPVIYPGSGRYWDYQPSYPGHELCGEFRRWVDEVLEGERNEENAKLAGLVAAKAGSEAVHGSVTEVMSDEVFNQTYEAYTSAAWSALCAYLKATYPCGPAEATPKMKRAIAKVIAGEYKNRLTVKMIDDLYKAWWNDGLKGALFAAECLTDCPS